MIRESSCSMSRVESRLFSVCKRIRSNILFYRLSGSQPKLRAVAHSTDYASTQEPREYPQFPPKHRDQSASQRHLFNGISSLGYLARSHMHAWLMRPMHRHFVMTAVAPSLRCRSPRPVSPAWPWPRHACTLSRCTRCVLSSLCGLLLLL